MLSHILILIYNIMYGRGLGVDRLAFSGAGLLAALICTRTNGDRARCVTFSAHCLLCFPLPQRTVAVGHIREIMPTLSQTQSIGHWTTADFAQTSSSTDRFGRSQFLDDKVGQ